MFAFGSEIAEAGKKVKGAVEIIYPEGQPHIMYIKMKMVVLHGFGNGDAVWRKVYACNIKTISRQQLRMAATAAGHIQQPGIFGQLQPAQQPANKSRGFLFVAFKI